jgi:hypothetical protein
MRCTTIRLVHLALYFFVFSYTRWFAAVYDDAWPSRSISPHGVAILPKSE